MTDARGELLAWHNRFVGWVESWVSNPVSSYSVYALDGLFSLTRDKIARLREIESRAAPARCDAESAGLATFTPITGPGVDALENRKEADNGPSEEQVNADLRRYLVPPPSEAGREAPRADYGLLPDPETMLTYASILVKPQYQIDKQGRRFLLATGEIIEAAAMALRLCARRIANAEETEALSLDPGTVASAQYRCTCGAEPYCAPNVHAASCPLAVTSTHHRTPAE